MSRITKKEKQVLGNSLLAARELQTVIIKSLREFRNLHFKKGISSSVVNRSQSLYWILIMANNDLASLCEVWQKELDNVKNN